ncbi:AAA family ATPase [uncultured Desulfobacter sp.]|uniref:ATP-binding protein n=1 Tax=uncultured Desulfobacter sp. TaxID=240139 RepID=UPI002AA8A94E|nr:AAA family ATPase [uncultured Desulfobacter sp.]
MTKKDKLYFSHVSPGTAGHFVIYLYAAIYRLMNQIRRLSEVGGSSLEEVFERYPFLGEYFNEMRSYMPRNISWDEATGWWRRQLELWEAQASSHLPLRALIQKGSIGFASCLAFMVTGLVEEDSRFGTLFAELQEPLNQRRPTLEMVGQMMMDEAVAGQMDPWSICRSLLDMGLVEAPNRQAPRSEWVLKVPSLLWDAVRGQVSGSPAPWCRYHAEQSLGDLPGLIADTRTREHLEKIPGLIRTGMAQMVIIRAMQGAHSIEVMGTIARSLGFGLLNIDGSGLGEDQQVLQIGPLCTMANAMPVFTYDPGPGETVSLPPLKGYDGPVGIILGMEGGLSSNCTPKVVTLTLPVPKADLRQRFWEDSFSGHMVEDLGQIAERFRLPGDFIRKVAHGAIAHAGLEGNHMITANDVRSAARTLNRQMLDTLASPIQTGGHWQDLVSSETTSAKLNELFLRCRHREKLLDHLGGAFGNGTNCGVRTLFTGASGTGKTLAAGILAAELGMDLYRVDLAAVINKYIGETEKNLHRVLSRAEALDVVLLLDEGDALLGHRTEVKSANDRYANLETNYLLQRLENYQGIVAITTNLVENIDRAFQRRMDVVVPFFPPQVEERFHILQLHLPDTHQVDSEFMALAARRCAVNGGQLRNAVLHATLLSIDAGRSVDNDHLKEGLRSEYRKAGATFPLDNMGDPVERDGGMESFVDALNFTSVDQATYRG